MTPTQLIKLLISAIPAKVRVLIEGIPGIGKTSCVQQAAKQLEYDVLCEYASLADPTDGKGIPWFDVKTKEAHFHPLGTIAKALRSTKPTIIFLDDFGQATPAVQAAFMPWILTGSVNGHRLPEHVTWIAATNNRAHRAGVNGLLEPVKSRFDAIVTLEPNLEDSCNWAYSTNGMIPPHMIAFWRYRPELLAKFEPTLDLQNSPLPRTWESVAKLEALQLPADVESIAIAGAVGQGAAAEYLAFRQMVSSLITADEVILNPASAMIPHKPDELFALSCALAARTNVSNLARVTRYCERLMDAMNGEFATLLVKDAVRRDPAIIRSQAGVKLMTGKLGALIGAADID